MVTIGHASKLSELGTPTFKINTRIMFAGIFLTSLSGLVLEIAITRIFSAAIWYHFAFVAVSVALVGLGSSGLLVHYRLKKIKENWAHDLTIASSIGICIILPITLYVMHSLASQVVYLPLFMFLFSIPFFFVGVVISTAFSAFAQNAGRLYAFDLIGASVGSLSVVLFLSLLGGEGTVLLVGIITSVCAAIFSVTIKNKKKIIISIAFVAFAVSLLGIHETTQMFSIPTDPTANKDLPIFLRENPGSHIAKTQWNSFSRIDVVEGISGNCIPSLDTRNPSQCVDEGVIANNLSPTLEKDKTSNRLEALHSLYKLLRPGDLATDERVEDLFQSTFFDEKRFDLGEIARIKMTSKLGIKTKYEDENGKFLAVEDLVESLKYFLNLFI